MSRSRAVPKTVLHTPTLISDERGVGQSELNEELGV
jgi:hypothetical protein